jgi:hypothetical protein
VIRAAVIEKELEQVNEPSVHGLNVNETIFFLFLVRKNLHASESWQK